MVKYAIVEEELEIPKEVDFSFDLETKILTIKGEKGTNEKDFSHAKNVHFSYDPKTRVFRIWANFPKKRTIAMIQTLKSHTQNAIEGVIHGYTYYMKMVYSHFPHTVKLDSDGNTILIENFLGERAPRRTKMVGNIDIKVTKEDVILSGTDKDHLGQTCANIQLRTKIKKKDPRIFQDGVFIWKKMRGDEVLWEVR